jgi:hypothetical protein
MENLLNMKNELLNFSERIEEEFDFGDDKAFTWLRWVLRLLGW